MRQKSLILLLIFSNFLIYSLPAQSVLKPTLILVQLNTESLILSRLDPSKDIKQIKYVQTYTSSLNQSIMNDFNENFSFCPVYFFYDTCLNKITQHDWNNVTFLDATAKVVNINQSFTQNIWIAEIGYPPAPDYPDINSDEKQETPIIYANANTGSNIVMHDISYAYLKNKLVSTNGHIYKKMGTNSVSRYVGAALLQKKLTRFFN